MRCPLNFYLEIMSDYTPRKVENQNFSTPGNYFELQCCDFQAGRYVHGNSEIY